MYCLPSLTYEREHVVFVVLQSIKSSASTIVDDCVIIDILALFFEDYFILFCTDFENYME